MKFLCEICNNIVPVNRMVEENGVFFIYDEQDVHVRSTFNRPPCFKKYNMKANTKVLYSKVRK